MAIQTMWPPPHEERPAEAGPEEKQLDSRDHTLDQSLQQRASRPLKPRTKAAAVLRILLERGERGLNCFEAVRLAHDYTLRSTVSNMRLEYGVTCERRHEQVPGHGGGMVTCVRYWLADEGRARAAELLRRAT